MQKRIFWSGPIPPVFTFPNVFCRRWLSIRLTFLNCLNDFKKTKESKTLTVPVIVVKLTFTVNIINSIFEKIGFKFDLKQNFNKVQNAIIWRNSGISGYTPN